MKRVIFSMLACLLATVVVAQDAPAPELNLPQIQPTQCDAVAQVRGNMVVDAYLAQANEIGAAVQGVQGGCGTWELTDEQLKNLPELFLEDVQAGPGSTPGVTCSILSSQDTPGPLGRTADVLCEQEVQVDEETTLTASLVISLHTDGEGDVLVIFVSAIR